MKVFTLLYGHPSLRYLSYGWMTVFLCLTGPGHAQGVINGRNSLDTVEVRHKAPDWYKYLIRLRDKNAPQFLNEDSTIVYAFRYKNCNLQNGGIIDSAYGYFAVDYKGGYRFPMKFLNFEGSRLLYFCYYYDSLQYTAEDLSTFRYASLSTLLSLYNLMDKGTDGQWKIIKRYKERINFEVTNEGKKLFTTYFRDGKPSRYILFDSLDNIEHIAFLRPYFLWRSNYNADSCDFHVAYFYNKTYPRIAYHIEERYTVRSGNIPYSMELTIEPAGDDYKTTLRQVKKGSFVRAIYLSAGADFYTVHLGILEGKKEGNISENTE